MCKARVIPGFTFLLLGMAGIKSKTSRWCFLRDNFRIKTLIKQRMDERKLTATMVAEANNIDQYRVSRYLRNKHIDSEPSVTQYQLVKICGYLGIDLDLKVTLNNDES